MYFIQHCFNCRPLDSTVSENFRRFTDVHFATVFGSGIRDPGSGIRDPGSGINIPDPPHWYILHDPEKNKLRRCTLLIYQESYIGHFNKTNKFHFTFCNQKKLCYCYCTIYMSRKSFNAILLQNSTVKNLGFKLQFIIKKLDMDIFKIDPRDSYIIRIDVKKYSSWTLDCRHLTITISSQDK